MDNYIVEIWETQNKSKGYSPVFTANIILAVSPESPEMALRKALQENDFHKEVYAEVIWNNGHDRQKFENYSLS